jgi:hypothetical protein
MKGRRYPAKLSDRQRDLLRRAVKYPSLTPKPDRQDAQAADALKRRGLVEFWTDTDKPLAPTDAGRDRVRLEDERRANERALVERPMRHG